MVPPRSGAGGCKRSAAGGCIGIEVSQACEGRRLALTRPAVPLNIAARCFSLLLHAWRVFGRKLRSHGGKCSRVCTRGSWLHHQQPHAAAVIRQRQRQYFGLHTLSAILFINMCSNSRSHSRLHLCSSAFKRPGSSSSSPRYTHIDSKRLDALQKFQASSQQQIQKENAEATGKQLFSATLIPNSAPGIIFCMGCACVPLAKG